MINERTTELIQADVDGELGSENRAELEAALAASEEARKLRDDLGRVAHLMSTAPAPDLPWGFHRRLLDAIMLPKRPRLSLFASIWTGPASYGLAVAAGVLIAVGISRFAPQGQENMEDLVGTMVVQGDDLPGAPSSVLQIDVPAVSGRVQLKQMDQAWVLEFDLESREAVELDVELGEGGLTFGGFATQDSAVENFAVSGGNVRLMNQGNHGFVLFLREGSDLAASPKRIGVAVSHHGNNVFRGVLESNGG